jgi:small conductance mechanosensitive channel
MGRTETNHSRARRLGGDLGDAHLSHRDHWLDRDPTPPAAPDQAGICDHRHRDGDTDGERKATEKRVRTLSGLLRAMAGIGVWALVLVSILNEIGINIGPILAGVGILGLAIGFGAQNLVRDVISGVFMILENQVRVGDVAVVNGTGGMVEEITFRTIVLRDVVLCIVPDGSVTTLANHTKYWSAYILDIAVAYDEDIDRTVEVMKKVADELRSDPGFTGKMIAPIEVFGVDSFGQSEMVIKARLKTQPADQWDVGREYRRLIRLELGNQILFLQRVFITGPGRLARRLHGGEFRPRLREDRHSCLSASGFSADVSAGPIVCVHVQDSQASGFYRAWLRDAKSSARGGRVQCLRSNIREHWPSVCSPGPWPQRYLRRAPMHARRSSRC